MYGHAEGQLQWSPPGSRRRGRTGSGPANSVCARPPAARVLATPRRSAQRAALDHVVEQSEVAKFPGQRRRPYSSADGSAPLRREHVAHEPQQPARAALDPHPRQPVRIPVGEDAAGTARRRMASARPAVFASQQ